MRKICSACLCMVLCCVTVLFFGPAAQGQLFGERTLGRSLSRGQTPGSRSSNAGMVGGDRRFLRDQRSATDFVGAAPAGGGASGFVGGASAVNTAVSSVVGLREELRPPLNRPRIVRNSGLYAERLSFPSGALPADNASADRPLSGGLQSILQERGLSIEVSMADHSATLRGEVPSEHDRQMAATIVSFEPGIQNVKNELTVNPNLPPASRREHRQRWRPAP